MEQALVNLLLSSTLEQNAVTELTRLGIVKMDLLAAVKDEAELGTLVTCRVKWVGFPDKHIAKGLGLSRQFNAHGFGQDKEGWTDLVKRSSRWATNAQCGVAFVMDRLALSVEVSIMCAPMSGICSGIKK